MPRRRLMKVRETDRMTMVRRTTRIDPSPPGPAETREADVFQQSGQMLHNLLSTRVPRPDQDPMGVAALCHGALALQALGEVHRLPDSMRDGLSHALDRMQDPGTGLFLCDRGRTAAPLVDSLAMTRLAIETLRALDRKSLYPLSVVIPWTDIGPDDAWLAGDAPATLESAHVLILVLELLMHVAERHAEPSAQARVHQLLDALDAAQDCDTGLWKAGPALDRSVIATSNIVRLFQHVRRPVQRLSRICDSVHACWPGTDEAGFADSELQLAAVHLLSVRLAAGNSPEIRDVLERCFAKIRITMAAVVAAGDQVQDDDLLRSSHLRLAAARRIATVLRTGHADTHDSAIASPSFATPARTENGERTIRFWIRDIPPLIERLAHPGSPIVTVVIPCYNLGIYLHEALASVAAQSLNELDVVVVDDGSTDSLTLTILDHWMKRGLRVIHQQNAGVASARNNGILATTSPYLCCLDPDDRLGSDFLERAVAIMDRDPDVGFVTGHTRIFDDMDGFQRPERCDLPRLLVSNVAVQPSVFRRSVWQDVGGYWNGFSSSGIEDWDLWLRILRAGHRAEIVPTIAWEYRIRPGQMSDGMYETERWMQLTSELARRHAPAFDDHFHTIFAGQQVEWVRMRNWTNEQRRGISFWRGQASAWQAAAEDRDSTIADLRAWIQELEQAKAWWQDQAENWRRVAHSRTR